MNNDLKEENRKKGHEREIITKLRKGNEKVTMG